MKKLCFGSFMTVLKLCKARGVTQKLLCGTVLLSVAPNYDIREEDGTVSDLLLCKKDLSTNVTTAAPTADAQKTADYFKEKVLPLLNGNELRNGVLALKEIIGADDTIKPDTTVDRVSGLTKTALLASTSFEIEGFLAGLFLYTASVVDNKDGKASIGEIDAAYIKSFEPHTGEIALVPESIASRTMMTKVIRSMDIGAAATFADELVDGLLPAVRPDNSLLITLLTESSGNCLRCGKSLAIRRNGAVPASNCEIVYLPQTPDELLYAENVLLLSQG